MQPHGFWPTRLLCPWGFSRQKILEWVAMLFSRGIFPTQGSNPGLLHCRWILYHLSHQSSLKILEWVAILSPGDLPNPGIEPGSPAVHADSSQLSYPGKPFPGFSSIQSLSRVRSLQPHESQHARPPCPLPTPGVHSDSYPLDQ